MYSPYEVLTVAAEGWMLEKSRDEFVLLDLRDVLLLESSLSSPSFSRQGHVFLQSPPLFYLQNKCPQTSPGAILSYMF